jgi:hypothetical protein
VPESLSSDLQLKLSDPVSDADLQDLLLLEAVHHDVRNGLGDLKEWLVSPRHILVATGVVQPVEEQKIIRQPVGAIFGVQTRVPIDDRDRDVFTIYRMFTADNVDEEQVTAFLISQLLAQHAALRFSFVYTQVPQVLQQTRSLLRRFAFIEGDCRKGNFEYFWDAMRQKKM